MSYFQSFHFSIFSFPEAFFPQNAAFPEFCTLECLISKVFIFRFLASQKLFFRKTLHFRISALWNVFFPKFSFFVFFFLKSFFFIILYFLSFFISYFLLFPFSIFFFSEAFFCKTLHFWSSVLWNVLFLQSLFFDFYLHLRFFFSQNAAFPEFCTLECLISKVFIFRFLAS